MIEARATTEVDATAYFTEPDGQPLTFSASTSDGTVASVTVLGSTVTVRGEAPGKATVTVAARDPGGLAAEQNFAVTVESLSERNILALLHRSTGGPNWFGDENWLTNAPLGEWFGVDVDDEGRVVGLELYRNNLAGPIPAELAGLTSLSRLELGSNRLSGTIPPELGELHGLSHLGLFNNRLEGQVPPEFGNLADLAQLELDRNPLTGVIPATFLALDLTRFYFAETRGLCAPGTPAFADWIAAMEGRHEGPFCNQSDVAVLTALFNATGGGKWTMADGWLKSAATGGWHGVGADSLGRVTSLDLGGNGLDGRLPQNLGGLTHLIRLRLGDNALEGRLPSSLAALPLRELRYSGTGLCAPSEPSFRAWLETIPDRDGTDTACAPPSDRDILVAFHDATGGSNWTNNENWITDAALDAWHGVHVDSEGRVTTLRLQNNGLAGALPGELGNLSELRELLLWNNHLSGPIPAELADLRNLRTLRLWNNNLAGPIPPEMGLLRELRILGLGNNRLTGSIPTELGDLANLTDLALDDNALEGPIPPELGNLSDLKSLRLARNHLTGSLPPALGDLAGLAELVLNGNALTGSIPPELARLTRLRSMILSENRLTGSIPPELGDLPELSYLALADNRLTGPVPPELGDLPGLRYLIAADNNLTGPIPSRLGRLPNARHLALSDNRLTGSIPPELGGLGHLEHLFVDGNDLTGPLPPELGRAPNLRRLGLANNAGLSGSLPHSLTELKELETIVAGGTDLCAPSDATFARWLDAVPKRRVPPCPDSLAVPAYLVQSVQSRAYPVPLVAGVPALLRVFVTAADAGGAGMPGVRARFYRGGVETHVAEIPPTGTPIPAEVDEGDLAASANAEISGEVIQPGLEMVIEVDPRGTLDPALGVARRIPAEGRIAVDARALPPLGLTLVPFLLRQAPDSSIMELVAGMSADPAEHELLRDTRSLLPVGDIVVEAHEPVLTSTNNVFDLLGETAAIRTMEGGTGHYMGMMGGRTTGARGVATLPGRASFSRPDSRIVAHELGHNMNLHHAPCGGAAGPDPSYPETDGSIGAWGYDIRGGTLIRPGRRDLMSYCEPPWISDYYFTNALRFRERDEENRATAVAAAPARALLLWGGVGLEGEPFLEPAFVLDAPPSLPQAGGAYELSGREAGGGALFSLRFDMPRLADAEGRASFAFVLPAQDGWAGRLAGITLAGPGGTAVLDEETVRPMAILRDPETGRIRGILRDPPPAQQAAMDAARRSAGLDLEVLYSSGIPDAEAWRR